MYGPILPLALLGWKRDEWMDSYILILALPFASIILAPTMAISAWHRSAFLLTIPMTIYAANYLMEKRRLKCFYIGFLVAFMSVYIMLPPELAFPYYVLSPPTYRYIPTSMLQNSVSREDLADVADSVIWLNSHMENGSCLLAPEAYQGWARLYIDREDVKIIPFNMSLITPEVAKKFYSLVYLIWWNRNMNWYEWSPPMYFKQINQHGRIAVYEYEGNSSA
jgi:hypothetical protein